MFLKCLNAVSRIDRMEFIFTVIKKIMFGILILHKCKGNLHPPPPTPPLRSEYMGLRQSFNY